MTILMILLLFILMALTTGWHVRFAWKRKKHNLLFIQIGIISLAFLLGILTIYNVSELSISSVFNTISPVDK
ncbi:hypothetical protein [Lentibacillus salicampi]|uniref:Uncharacterized protein n=1 Tax=Lentibacillus salicampi TaxID=175306 RepID=A0A4Y9ACF2_9BACI|nr:hypothetical protein [Lentibacillus salicampi]TFJ93578.1 hypothetical protein E4U82_06360 [Lentibacillus salicampi]